MKSEKLEKCRSFSYGALKYAAQVANNWLF